MYLTKFISGLVEIVFPVRDDAQVVIQLSPADLPRLQTVSRNGDTVTLLPFSSTAVRACIHEVKFHDNERAAELLGGVLHAYLTEIETDTVVLPVPLSPERKAERKYNQVERIAKKGIAGLDQVTLLTDVLIKVKETKPQTKLSRKDRLKNVADAFGIRDQTYAEKVITGKHIIILDDVMTTGATLRAAKAALSPLKPSSVTCVALAH